MLSLRLALGLIVAISWLSPGTALARDVAIVIGNSEYSYLKRIPNAANDAIEMARTLQSLGFEVFEGQNLTLQQTRSLILLATNSKEPVDKMVLFYAGHGVQVDGANLLLASDADDSDQDSLAQTSLDILAIAKELALRSKSTVILLDACRTNPFGSGSYGSNASAGASGLAETSLPGDTFIAYSTEPGKVALEGPGRNSPFTQALLRHIRTPNSTIHDIMREVRSDVRDETSGAQVPWEKSALTERVVFSIAPALSAPRVVPITPNFETFTFGHEVRGLNPTGDGFLSLRVAPSASSSELRKLIEGTSVSVLNQSGAWWRVRLVDGQEGWAHSNWISAKGSVAPAPVPQTTQAAPTDTPNTCEDLYFARNKIFDDYGYCFQSKRAQRVFSNAGCNPGLSAGAVPLTSDERALIARLKAREQSLGC